MLAVARATGFFHCSISNSNTVLLTVKCGPHLRWLEFAIGVGLTEPFVYAPDFTCL